MKRYMQTVGGINVFLIAIALMISACSESSSQNVRVSPLASVSQTIGEATEITIQYSRPGVKGRTIWGDLVKYGEVWRTGANEATSINFSQDVLVEGQALPAGRYSFHTIPGESSWTLIFNKQAEQWGSYNYNQEMDALRLTVTPQSGGAQEWMGFSFQELAGTSAVAVLSWDKLRVPFKIEAARTEGKIRPSLKAGVSQTLGDSTTVSLVYSRPGVKGRTIWGELVPYDKVWRTGANENTTIAFSGDVVVEGMPLAAGTYGLHTIPGETSWVIIFSKTADAWGSSDYSPENDALRVEVKPHQSDSATEWFTIAIDKLIPDPDKVVRTAEVHLSWDHLTVPFTVALPQ